MLALYGICGYILKKSAYYNKLTLKPPNKALTKNIQIAIMMRKFAILVKNDPEVIAKGHELKAWLLKRGKNVSETICVASHTDYACTPDWLDEVDCMFVLGGDGTFLFAARKVGLRPIALVGIKFGTLGFLAESSGESMYVAVERVLNNDYQKTSRMRLEATLYRAEKQQTVSALVLNDVVLTRGALARLVNIETYIHGSFLTNYRADGLVVATPTGSTGHSLAAGGPVVHPQVPSIVLTPICPVNLTNRPLLIPDSSEVTIKLGAESTNMTVTFDGQEGYNLSEKDVISIKKSASPLNMLIFTDRTYYDILKEKLSWNL